MPADLLDEPVAARIASLRRSLANRLGWRDIALRPYREGVDAWVDLVVREGAPSAVIKSAKVERLLTRYEGMVDFGAELPKQAAASQLLADHGVPTPRILALNAADRPEDEPSWMVMELVEQEAVDWAEPDLHWQLGSMARRIHDIRPSGAAAVLLGREAAWEGWIADRIARRVAAAGTYLDAPDPVLVRRCVEQRISGRAIAADALLHLDLRPTNIAVQSGRIASLFDLGNVMLGDPLLELARIRAAGLLSDAFLQGYGLTRTALAGVADIVDTYELDIAALLVVVSREEFDEPQLHSAMAIRTVELCNRLCGAR